MIRTTVRNVALVASCSALLLVSACSGPGGDEGDGKKGGSPASEWTPGPLDEYTARIYGYSLDQDEQSQEEAQARSDAQNREVEELVATCMQEQGFDYTPNDNNGGTVVTTDELDVEWGTREFAEKYGYGISTDPYGSSDDPAEDGSEYVDPNQEYIESMSESEAAAYNEALWGPTTEFVEGEEATEYDWTQGGCYGAAQHEVFEGGAVADEFSALADEVNALWETIDADPRIAELKASWASCMADAGFDGLTDINTAQEPLYEEWNALQGWEDPEYQAQMETWDWEAEPDGPPAPEPDPAALTAFTEKEIAMATADFTCQEEIDYVKTTVAVNHEVQQEFVDAHRDELDAWAEAATAARDA
jgi:hypothetical protein